MIWQIFAESRAAVKWAMVGAVVLGATIPTASWLLNSAESAPPAPAPAWVYTINCQVMGGVRSHQVGETGWQISGDSRYGANTNGRDIFDRRFSYSLAVPCWLENAQ